MGIFSLYMVTCIPPPNTCYQNFCFLPKTIDMVCSNSLHGSHCATRKVSRTAVGVREEAIPTGLPLCSRIGGNRNVNVSLSGYSRSFLSSWVARHLAGLGLGKSSPESKQCLSPRVSPVTSKEFPERLPHRHPEKPAEPASPSLWSKLAAHGGALTTCPRGSRQGPAAEPKGLFLMPPGDAHLNKML